MAKRKGAVGRGRGKGKGKVNTPIGEGELSPTQVGVISSTPELFDDVTDLHGLGLENQHDHMGLRTGSSEGFDAKESEDEVEIQDSNLDVVSQPIIQDDDCASLGGLEGALIGSPEVLIDSDLENDGFIDHLSGLKPQGDVQDQVLAESSSGGAPLIEVSKNGIDHLDDSKGWRGLFTDNRTMGNLKFFPPKKEGDKTYIYPPDTVVEEGISRWKSSLVGQFMDKSLPYFLVKKSVTAMWSQYGEVEVFSLENGMYIFRLKDEATCDEILESKIWHVSNKALILRKWKPGMQVLKLALSSVPVWVKFLHLPMEFWTSNGLSYVASGVGVPLYADKVTEEQKRLGFARVLIEIDVHSACPKELIICRANGDMVTVGVVYSWLPPKCSTCGTFGHATYTCNKKEQKVWVPKKISNSPHKKASLGAKPGFDRTISKPGMGPKPKGTIGEIRLSNSFDRISQDGEFEEEDKPRTPTTFLEVFEKAMSDKGKGNLVASPAGKGFSLPIRL